ncbi:MAG: MarR family transcriptional regulator [Sphingomonadales bacterium]|nr:MarR family transcriptional regulator [Sphingomonadales bacterium]
MLCLRNRQSFCAGSDRKVNGFLAERELEAIETKPSGDSAGAVSAGAAPARPGAARCEEEGVGAIDDIIGFHIRLAHGATYRHFTETFTELGLTQKMVSVLWLINDHPHIAQADIGRRLQMDRATTMAIVNRLEARNLLVRGESTIDRRRQTLNLTDVGETALIDARKAIDAHESWLKSRFTKREAALLIELLRRIHE